MTLFFQNSFVEVVEQTKTKIAT